MDRSITPAPFSAPPRSTMPAPPPVFSSPDDTEPLPPLTISDLLAIEAHGVDLSTPEAGSVVALLSDAPDGDAWRR